MVNVNAEKANIASYVFSELSAETDVSEILKWLVDMMADRIQADVVVMYPYSGTAQEGRFEDPIIAGRVQSGEIDPPRLKGLTRRIMMNPDKILEVRLGDVILVDNRPCDSPEDYNSRFVQREGIQSYLGVRLELDRTTSSVSHDRFEGIRGVCYVDRRSNTPFTDSDKEIVRFLADQAALAIEFARLGLRARIGKAAEKISSITKGKPSERMLLEAIVEQACRLLDAPTGCVWLYADARRKKLKLAAAFGEARKLRELIPCDDSLTGKFLSKGGHCEFIANVQEDPEFHADTEASEADLCSLLFAPLFVHGELKGAFNIYSIGKQRTFGKWHEDVITSFAALSSIALNIPETLRVQLLAKEKVVELAEILSRIHDLDGVLQFTVNQAVKLTEADGAHLYPYNPATGNFYVGKVSTKKRKLRRSFMRRIPRDHGLSEAILETGRRVQVPDTGRPVRLGERVIDINERTQELGIKSQVGFPVKHGKTIVGVLFIDFLKGKDFSELDMLAKMEWVDILTGHAAIAMENASLLEQIRRNRVRSEVVMTINTERKRAPSPEEEREPSSERKKEPSSEEKRERLIDQWRGEVRLEGAKTNASSFELNWKTGYIDKLMNEVDGIGETAYQPCSKWPGYAKDLGSKAARALMYMKPAEAAHLVKYALSQRDYDAKLSFRVPHDLMRFPFEFAWRGDFWALTYPISRYLVGVKDCKFESFDRFLSELVFAPPSDRKLRVLIVAPEGGSSGASDESERITDVLEESLKNLVEVEQIVGADATCRGVWEQMKSERYDIFHFSGHSVFKKGAPDKSYLQLAGNGCLAAKTLTFLLRRSGVKFVYLSSCQGGRTGEAKPGLDNCLGLSDAAVRAEVSAVLAYRWPVIPCHASLIATRFYESLFSMWSSPSRSLELSVALRDARVRVRNEIWGETAKKETDDGCWLSPVLITQY